MKPCVRYVCHLQSFVLMIDDDWKWFGRVPFVFIKRSFKQLSHIVLIIPNWNQWTLCEIHLAFTIFSIFHSQFFVLMIDDDCKWFCRVPFVFIKHNFAYRSDYSELKSMNLVWNTFGIHNLLYFHFTIFGVHDWWWLKVILQRSFCIYQSQFQAAFAIRNDYSELKPMHLG